MMVKCDISWVIVPARESSPVAGGITNSRS
jgi:hypothetical protein